MEAGRLITDLAAAFDALASDYDRIWNKSISGRLQREAVWSHADHLFRAGERILDLGCGTGEDAVHFARAGIRVHALDLSWRMLEAARQRLVDEGLSEFVTCEAGDLENLERLSDKGPFDGAISNFGVVNCVRDLERVASPLADLVVPGGRLLLCFMGRFCLWETLWYLLHGQPSKSFRRMRQAPQLARLNSEDPRSFRVFYPSVSTVRRAFSRSFQVISQRGVGVWTPPSYAESAAKKLPRVFEALARVERGMDSWPMVRSMGDHRLIVLVRS